MIIGSRTYSAEGEDDIAGREGASQRGRDARRVVAEILGPVEFEAAPAEDLDRLRKVLVLPLADEDLVADDQRPECHAGILSADQAAFD